MSKDAKFPKLRKILGMGANVQERSQGCWSCIHWSSEKAIALWWSDARKAELAKGIIYEQQSPLGKDDPRVLAIAKSVIDIDVGMESGLWGTCSGGGMTYKLVDGRQTKIPVGHFVQSVFLCENWSGAQGSSIARAGAKPDMLPGEAMERNETDN